MTEATNKAVITMELDESHFLADLPKADAIFMEFVARMQAAANITPVVNVDKLGRVKISIPVDPKSTTAGLEVIDNIVKEFSGRWKKEARINVGVDTTQVPRAFAAVRNLISNTARGLGAAFAFTFSRGIENALQAMIKAPIKLVGSALGEFRESEEAAKSLTKAINATGGQAKKSKEELEAYGKELEKLTNISDEAIAKVQAHLLSSEGLTGGLFDRATRGALDLAEALGGDAASHAERLGKALQDPVRGMKMLRDAGISFTPMQKEMIKLFVETGDLVSAQSIVLDELESRYGGTANATGNFTDSMKGLSLAYGNFLEDMGEAIASTDTGFIPAMEKGVQTLSDLTPAIVGTAKALADLAVSFLEVADNAEDFSAMDPATKTNKISEWASAIKGNFAGVEGMLPLMKLKLAKAGEGLADNFMDMFNLSADGELKQTQLGKYFEGIQEEQLRLIDEAAAEIEQASIEARAKRKEQDKLDLEAAQEKYKDEQKVRDDALARGSGLVTEADIKEKGGKQALKDAKLAIAHKKAAAKAIRDAELAEEKDEREFKRAIRERIAKQNKESADAIRARTKAESEEASRLAKEARERKKADTAADKQADKATGDDSLEGMHKRIQDSLLNRKGGAMDVSALLSVQAQAEKNEASKRRSAFRDAKKKEREDKWTSVFGGFPVDEDVLRRNLDNQDMLDAFRPIKRGPQFAAEDPTDRRSKVASESDNRAFGDPGRLEDVVKAIGDSTKAIVKSNEDKAEESAKMGR